MLCSCCRSGCGCGWDGVDGEEGDGPLIGGGVGIGVDASSRLWPAVYVCDSNGNNKTQGVGNFFIKKNKKVAELIYP